MEKLVIGKIYYIAPASGSKTFMVRIQPKKWVNYPCSEPIVLLSISSSFYKALMYDGLIGEFYVSYQHFVEKEKNV